MSGARDPRGRLLAVAMLLLVMPGMVLAEARGRAAVIDGDTLDVSGTEVRLSGIDAPELDQRCYPEGGELVLPSRTALGLLVRIFPAARLKLAELGFGLVQQGDPASGAAGGQD